MNKAVLILLTLLISNTVWAGAKVFVPVKTSQIKNELQVASTNINGIGDVKLTARKSGNQIIVHAQDASGKAIGKAETVVGLKETPIYVMSPNGLKKITIHWGSTKAND